MLVAVPTPWLTLFSHLFIHYYSFEDHYILLNFKYEKVNWCVSRTICVNVDFLEKIKNLASTTLIAQIPPALTKFKMPENLQIFRNSY